MSALLWTCSTHWRLITSRHTPHIIKFLGRWSIFYSSLYIIVNNFLIWSPMSICSISWVKWDKQTDSLFYVRFVSRCFKMSMVLPHLCYKIVTQQIFLHIIWWGRTVHIIRARVLEINKGPYARSTLFRSVVLILKTFPNHPTSSRNKFSVDL